MLVGIVERMAMALLPIRWIFLSLLYCGPKGGQAASQAEEWMSKMDMATGGAGYLGSVLAAMRVVRELGKGGLG